MTKPDEREPIRIIDIVVLIAATALGLAAIRVYSAAPRGVTFYTPYSVLLGNPPSLSDPRFLCGAASAFLWAWSPALLWCGCRRGLRGFWKIMESPGLLACAVAVLVVPFFFVLPVKIEIASPQGAAIRFPDVAWGMFAGNLLGFLRHKVGGCVVLAWVVLAASRSWRKPVGWVEWSGLAVGVGWIATWLTSLAFG